MKKHRIYSAITALILTIVTLTAMTPFVSAMQESDEDVERADLKWETIPITKGAVTREGLDVQGNGAFSVDGGSGAATRESFMEIDLSPYFDGSKGIINIEELRLKVNLTEKVAGGNIGIYILPPELSYFDPSTLKGATVLNGVRQGETSVQYKHPDTGTSMRNDISGLVGTFMPESKAPFYTDNIWPKVKLWLDAHPGVTKITLRLSKEYSSVTDSGKTIGSINTGSRVTYTITGFIADNTPFNRPFFRIGFKDEAIMKVEESMAELTFDKISSENAKNITQSLTLPTVMSNGVSVNWKSSQRETLSNDGTVTRPAYGKTNTELTLTGAFSYEGYSASVKYDLTVLADAANPYYKDNTRPVTDAVSAHRITAAVNTAESLITDNNDYIFLKADLSSYKNNLDNLDSIKLRLAPYNDDKKSGNKIFRVFMSDYDSWTKSGITSADITSVLNAATLVDTFNGEFDDTGVYYAWDILRYVKSYFTDNPSADGIVTFVVRADNGAVSIHGINAKADDLKPSVIAVSYADALKETKDYITADKIYGGTISRVRSDLNLFKKWKYYPDITWSSPDNDKGVINLATGEVTRLFNEDAVITLNATIKSGGLTDVATIAVTVLGLSSDAAFFKALLDDIEFPTMALTDGFNVPTEREMLDITWTTDKSGVLDIANGKSSVERLKDGDSNVKATATISDLGVSVSRDFNFTVIRHAGNDLLLKKTILDDKVILDEEGNDIGPGKLHAIDNNTNTAWRLSDADRKITIDLSAPKMLGEFIIVYDGQPTSGFKVEMALESEFKSPTVCLSGVLEPKVANHLSSEKMAYARYIRLTCPTGVTQVRFLGGYSSQNNANSDDYLWRNVIVPTEASSDFALPPETTDGFRLNWWSSDESFIKIDGNTARVVKRDVYTQAIRLKAEFTADGTSYDKTFYIAVSGTGSNNPSIGGSSGAGTVRGSGGGGISTNVSNDLVKSDPPVTTPSLPFNDLNDAAWAKDYILELYGKGIISGRGEGKFEPNGYLKREEMSKLLVTAFSISASDVNPPFADVKSGEWYYNFVRDIYGNGVANGINKDTFGVGLNISRQDAALLIARIIDARKITAESKSAEKFADDGQIAEYARDGVYTLKAFGILSGNQNGEFNPYADVTRAEMSKIIYEALLLVN